MNNRDYRYRNSTTKCKIDPLCDWVGPYHLRTEHYLRAHGMINEHTQRMQQHTVQERITRNKPKAIGIWFEDTLRLQVMLDELKYETYRHLLFDFRNSIHPTLRIREAFRDRLLGWGG